MWLKSNFQDHSDAKKVTRKASDALGRKPSSNKSRATTILKAMSNSQRLKILSHLIDGEERSVKELETVVKSLSQSSLSQHLGRLRRAKIVKTRRHSQMVFYSIHDDTVRDIISLLAEKFKNDPMLK
jgi:DNA-binding transcriptional ArsR family regulator